MHRAALRFKCWWDDQSGLETVEYVLLLTAFVIPFIGLMMKVVGWLGYFYSITSWVLALPFP